MKIHFNEARRHPRYNHWYNFGPRERELEQSARRGTLRGDGKSTRLKWVDSYRTIGLVSGAIIGVIAGYLTGRYYFAGSGTGAVIGIIIGFFSGSIAGRVLGYLAARRRGRK